MLVTISSREPNKISDFYFHIKTNRRLAEINHAN